MEEVEWKAEKVTEKKTEITHQPTEAVETKEADQQEVTVVLLAVVLAVDGESVMTRTTVCLPDVLSLWLDACADHLEDARKCNTVFKNKKIKQSQL